MGEPREHVISHYPGPLISCWCEPGVYHCTPEDWEAAQLERDLMQWVLEHVNEQLDRALTLGPLAGHTEPPIVNETTKGGV